MDGIFARKGLISIFFFYLSLFLFPPVLFQLGDKSGYD